MAQFTNKEKIMIFRISISMLTFIFTIIMKHFGILSENTMGGYLVILCSLVAYLIIGYDVLRKCFLEIIHGQIFDECLLMTIATIGAFACQEYLEAVAVMLFYQVGEFFQNHALGKSRNAINELLSIAPDFANREDEAGNIEVIDPDDIAIGDIIIVKPGEKIPTDGIVLEGSGYVNTAALTGESMPRLAEPGDEVISGCINGENLLRIQAIKVYEDSTVSRILELVESAGSRKSKTESFITRFARIYTPAIAISALVLAFLPPLVSGSFSAEFGKWVLRACSFLVISCPCALVISVPMAFFGGIGAASRIGVLVKGSNYLEMMAHIDTLVTDKTGTLTEGKFRVSEVLASNGYNADEVIRLAAAVEAGSTHPIGKAIAEACEKPYPHSKVSEITNYPGKGIGARVAIGRFGLEHSTVIVGNRKLLSELGIYMTEFEEDLLTPYEGMSEDIASSKTISYGSECYVIKDNMCIGRILVSDMPKEDAKDAIREIISEKVRRIVMLTGDGDRSAESIACELGLTEYKANLLPDDKVREVQTILDETRGMSNSDKHRLAFVGDGINDAPVLAIADVGIAMGSLGADAAIEAADVVIMDDKLKKIPDLIRIARRTIGISKMNITFSLIVKFICLVLGALGIANMWMAVFADVGVAMICILNSMRMLTRNCGRIIT